MQEDLIWFDEKGHLVTDYTGLKPPFFQGLPVPPEIFRVSSALCQPQSLMENEEVLDNLRLAVVHLSQSEIGRQTLRTISDNDIRFGFHLDLNRDVHDHDKNFIGRNDDGFYVLMDPEYVPSAQHLMILKHVSEIDMVLRLEEAIEISEGQFVIDPVSKAASVNGIVAVMQHVDECIAAKQDNIRRFIAPKLAETFNYLFSGMIQQEHIPDGKIAREAYRDRLLEEAMAALDPLGTLRRANPPGLEKGLPSYPEI